MTIHVDRMNRRKLGFILFHSIVLLLLAVGLASCNRNTEAPVDAIQQGESQAPLLSSPDSVSTATRTITSTPTPVPIHVDGSSPVASSTPSPVLVVEENMEAEAASIQSLYMDKLAILQEACANHAGSIVKELSAEIQANQKAEEGLSVTSLQKKFLPRIAEAEQNCDAQFGNLVASAEQEYLEKGLPLQDIGGWKSQYEAAKRRTQQQAVETLLSSLSR
jgi:hypothetical protein